MAVRCCHPILVWMINLLLVLVTCVLSILTVFTTFSARPRTIQKGYDHMLNVVEEICLAHFAFTILAAFFLHAAMKLVSTGGHRDYFYRIEKDFKILCGLVLASTLIVAVLGVVLYVYREIAFDFSAENAQVAATKPPRVNFAEWYSGSSRRPPEAEVKRESNVQAYILTLLIADIISFVLAIIGVVLVVGCNRREKYDVDRAVQRVMMSRVNSRSTVSSHHREYRYVS